MTISTRVWGEQHPNAGRNIQHACSVFITSVVHWDSKRGYTLDLFRVFYSESYFLRSTCTTIFISKILQINFPFVSDPRTRVLRNCPAYRAVPLFGAIPLHNRRTSLNGIQGQRHQARSPTFGPGMCYLSISITYVLCSWFF